MAKNSSAIPVDLLQRVVGGAGYADASGECFEAKEQHYEAAAQKIFTRPLANDYAPSDRHRAEVAAWKDAEKRHGTCTERAFELFKAGGDAALAGFDASSFFK
jgi:hypothetical protein